ncbi:hypothetical protein GUITHDRAFT_136757 [Guillardia theta CCMP2712]|uniref:Uncharacterized protein n=1 Tax=Guillardia theta (strain CCMP2712) TaxID=905079 RepID=L1JJG2_GUITC|nr:hypothetical protein GUITHDRAFT_136757 [Guillardia theta CCMP2712]EKX48230.1 hypothetical protein GUITHDRAFT_136757 [Guillardia theta CCMP2712]|eukprot:XP_005835210.1 hypothetical protein GUITHDRAFT_136757 [Guillardia theta CCMP2712]
MARGRIVVFAGAAMAAAALAKYLYDFYMKGQRRRKKARRVVFALTGFGKFDNVEINPTDVIVKKFPSYLEENPLPFEAAVDRCLVMEVSAEGCKERLSAMHKTCFRDHEDFRVWLHLGVAASKEEFQLEQVAWNGRFVCNWIYYCSLRSCRTEDPEGSDSLFVHVPPFSCIEEGEQLKFIHNLICQIATNLTS